MMEKTVNSDLFSEKARDWDENELVRELSSAIGEAILKRVPFDEHMTILDFGAGTGLISTRLAPKVGRIVAVDTSEAMLERLAAKPELQGKVEPVCQDITREGLDGRFDRIVSAMAMHHVADTERLIETFAEHLKPGGRLAVADLDTEDGSFHPEDAQGVHHHGFDRDALAALLKRHGFEDIHFDTAHVVSKEGRDYPVFLVTASRKN